MNANEKGPCQVPSPDYSKLQAISQPTIMVPRYSYLGKDKGRMPILPDRIPDVLKQRPQWVCWQYEMRGSKETKPPLNPRNGQYASVTDPLTWASFEIACAAYEAGMGEGIGFVFTNDDPFTGIDSDYCRDKESGEIEYSVIDVVTGMSSYTELSPSGEGIHIIIEGAVREGGKKGSIIEIYSTGRYFTITGNHFVDTPTTIEPRQAQLDSLRSRYFGADSLANAGKSLREPVKVRLPTPPDVDAEVEAIIAKATGGRSSDKFKKLMSGDCSGYDSQSEAELALCGLAAYYSDNNLLAIDGLIRKSGLLRPKWDEARGTSTYGQITIEKAIAGNAKKKAAQSDVSELEKSICEHVDEALASANPAEVIFTDEVVEIFAKLKKANSLEYARQKQRIKGRVNLTDLSAAVKLKLKRKMVTSSTGIGVIPSLVEHDKGYSVVRYKKDGPIVEALSNFKINLRERLTLPDGKEILSVELVVEGVRKRSIRLPYSAFISKRSLLESLGTSEAVWLGNDRDIQILAAHLLKQEISRLSGVTVAGRHDDVIILPGLVISKDGPVEFPTSVYVNPSRSGWVYSYSSSWPTDGEHRAAARAIFQYLPNINDAQITMPIIAWTAALAWAAIIRKQAGWGGFPHVCIWGQKGAGKTAYEEVIMRSCGVPAADAVPFSLPGTRFTRMDRSSCTNLIPICYDEYRAENFNGGSLLKFHEELRSLYGGGHEQRGRADLTVQDYDLVSPILLAGEDRPRDPALDERLIILNPSERIIRENDEFRASFNNLMSAPLEAFSLPYWAWALKQMDWIDVLVQQRDDVVRLANDKGLTIPFRIINNLAIIKFGWAMFVRYGEQLGINPEPFKSGTLEDAILTVLEQVMPGGKNISKLDELMSFIEVMITNCRLEQGTHFMIKQDRNLVLRLREVHAEAKKYARETNKEGGILGWDHYWGLVKSMAGTKDSYVLDSSTLADFGKGPSSDRRQLRGVLIDTDVLEKELGIEKDIWLSDA